MKRLKWLKPALLAMTTLAVMGGAALIAGDGSPALAAEQINVQAGGGDAGIAVNIYLA